MSRSSYPKSQPGNIPQQLQHYPQWANWHHDKVIRNSRTGRNGSSTDITTWSTFAQALKSDPDRLVFSFDRINGLVGLDVDGCRNAKTGELDARATSLIERFPGIYWEISLSGTGLHGIGYGVLPNDLGGTHPQGIGIFWHGRYFVMTGNVLPGHARTLGHFNSDDLAAFYREISPDKPKRSAPAASALTIEDHELCNRLRNDAKGSALLSGDNRGYPDYSSARAGLAWKACFYTDDVEQIARVIRSSGLFKDGDSERDRDRKAALDARNAVDQYVGPRYDPAYRTISHTEASAVLHDPTPKAEHIDAQSCPAQLMAAHAEIAELKAKVAARERVIERERELRIAAEQRAERLSIERSQIMQILRNPDLGTGEKLTHFTTVIDLGARIASGEEQAPQGFRLPAVRIAEQTGQSVQTVRKHWKNLTKHGVLDKRNVRERTEANSVDPDTGEITTATGMRDVSHIHVPENNIIHLIQPAATYERQEDDKQHGGTRTPKPVCTLHPEAGTLTRTVIECAECHQELSRSAGTYEAPAESSGINLIGEPPVSNTVLRATKLIGESARRSPTKMRDEPPLDDEPPDSWMPPDDQHRYRPRAGEGAGHDRWTA
jgi:DNA-binding transcriptional regulator YhcF (GntR family)